MYVGRIFLILTSAATLWLLKCTWATTTYRLTDVHVAVISGEFPLHITHIELSIGAMGTLSSMISQKITDCLPYTVKSIIFVSH